MSAWQQFRGLYPAAIAIVVGLLLVELLVYGVLSVASVVSYAGAELPENTAEVVGEAIGLRTWAFVIAAGVAAVSRFPPTNPAADRRYLTWLRTTPWTIDRPLPLGPFLPGWQDAIVLGVLTAWAFSGPTRQPVLVPAAFIGIYFLYAATVLAGARQWRYVLVSVALTAVAIGLRDPELALGLAIAGAIMVTHGMYRCLSRFHECPLVPSEAQANDPLVFHGPAALPQLQIPNCSSTIHHVLHGDHIEPFVLIRGGLFTSMLIGAGIWLALRKAEASTCAVVAISLICAVALLRLLVYLLPPPVSLRGRWRTGRWVIRAYDRACIAPLAVAGTGIGAWYALARSAPTPPIAAAAAVTLALVVAFCAGPTLGVHRLTGAQHYQVPTNRRRSSRCTAAGGA